MNNQEFFAIREKINELDSKLITLLKERVNLVLSVKKIKEQSQHKSFRLFIKPKREFEILSQIIKNEGYNPQFYYQTWRAIISASNFLEQPLQLASLCKTSQLELFHHFTGQQIPKVINSLNLIQEDQIHILAFKENNLEIWQELSKQNEIKIFAQIPSFSSHKTFLCGKIELDDFSPPATGVSWQEKPIFTNFTPNTNLIGAFYPLIIQQTQNRFLNFQ